MNKTDKVLKLVRLTEKSNKLSAELGQYTFEVFPGATKHSIADAVEKAFKVTVTRVNVQNYRGKNKRSRQGRPSVTSDYKKAIVTLKAGDKIELV
jgi:large subunit ribosomal protein L23